MSGAAGRWGRAAALALLAGLTASCATGPANAPGAAAAQGFEPLFDGRTLAGWRGDPAYWSVRDGAITGEAVSRIEESTFLIHEGRYRDFELHFKYRITPGGNSGFQFRSRVADEAKFNVAGYQANAVNADQEVRYGMIWDNLGRLELALLSEKVEITGGKGERVRNVLGSVNPVATLRAAYRPYPEWNDYVVIAHGNRIVQAINGQLTLDAVDRGADAASEGVFALQIDSFGTPMTVQFKDIAVKPIAAMPDLGRFASTPGPAETTAQVPKRPQNAAKPSGAAPRN